MLKSKLFKNTMMLYLFNAERIAFPLLLLPILTRRLSTDFYALYVLVGALTVYLRLFVDFGFDLSGTRDVVKTGDNNEVGKVLVDITILRSMLWVVGTLVLLGLCSFMSNHILKHNLLFLLLSTAEVLIEIFYFDYYFRGIEKMEYITLRYFVTKLISLSIIFIVVFDDSYILLIPVSNSVASLVGSLVVSHQVQILLHLRSYRLDYYGLYNRFKDSLRFFLTKLVATVFTASNTVVLGCFASSYDVVIWSLAVNIVSAVQSLYNPISNALFPSMVKNFNKKIIQKSFLIGLSIVLVVNIILSNYSNILLSVFAGEKYVQSSGVLSILLWMLFFSVGVGILGWPVLGALGGEKYMLYSTVSGAVFHFIGVCCLYYYDNCNAYTLAWLRVASECILFGSISVFVFFIISIQRWNKQCN